MSDETFHESQLADLRLHWGTAYIITLRGDGVWQACSPRDGVTLTAETATELRQLIRKDYKPVTGGVADVVRLRHPAAGKTTRVPPARDRGPS